MTIDYAVVSADNSDYLDYWPAVSKAWRKIGIEPILVYVGPFNAHVWALGRSEVYRLPAIDNVKSSLQAQIARIWAFNLLEGNCILSDIDMMPLSGSYFRDTAAPYDDGQIVSYCADAIPIFKAYHPICYVLASSAVMRPLIVQPTWEAFVQVLARYGGQGWFTDQWWLTKLLEKHGDVVSLPRGWGLNGVADNRLDRRAWGYTDKDVREGKYFDAHLPRPFHRFRGEIERLLSVMP